MKDLKTYLLALIENIHKLKYEQVIVGQDEHPKKTDIKTFPLCPDLPNMSIRLL